MSDPVLALEGVRVELGGQPVLDVPAFEVREGEVVALIGPNGAGKSTLLLALMGLVPRAAGRVLFRGEALEAGGGLIARRRRMAMVLQEPHLFDASVEQNVAAGLALRGVPREARRARVAEYLARFRLTELAGRAARKLSGGEARRVSLARAMVTRPEVVLLDEPFTSLDVPTRQAITDDLERTLREAGAAAVLVTHDQAEALRLCDRMAVMQAGRVVQSDVPAVVMNQPVNEFVAACVGMETILEGEVLRRERYDLAVRVGGVEVAAVGDAEPGERVYLCVRPENVILELWDAQRPTSVRNSFPARIAGVASAGPYFKVRLDAGFPVVAHVTAESYSLLRLAPGKEVHASFKATAVHLIRRVGAAAGAERPADAPPAPAAARGA